MASISAVSLDSPFLVLHGRGPSGANISSTSSRVLPHVSGQRTQNQAAAAMHSTPKIMNSFQLMLTNAGGVNMPRAKLKTQLLSAASDMPVARVPSDQT